MRLGCRWRTMNASKLEVNDRGHTCDLSSIMDYGCRRPLQQADLPEASLPETTICKNLMLEDRTSKYIISIIFRKILADTNYIYNSFTYLGHFAYLSINYRLAASSNSKANKKRRTLSRCTLDQNIKAKKETPSVGHITKDIKAAYFFLFQR